MTAQEKLRRAELRQAKKEASHQATIDYIDRGLALVNPIITSPVAALLAAFVAIDWAEAHQWDKNTPYDTILGPAAANTLRVAVTSGFVANAFGGPVAQIIGAVKPL